MGSTMVELPWRKRWIPMMRCWMDYGEDEREGEVQIGPRYISKMGNDDEDQMVNSSLLVGDIISNRCLSNSKGNAGTTQFFVFA